MPLCAGAWLELLQQISRGRRLDEHISQMRHMLATDPLCLVPKSRRSLAELNLRIAEYYSMLGLPPGKVSPAELKEQELKIVEARRKVEDKAKRALEKEKEKLRRQTASKLDTAQLAVDLLSMGRSWMEHFNAWSESQERRLDADREQILSQMQAMRAEIMDRIAGLEERLRRLETLQGSTKLP